MTTHALAFDLLAEWDATETPVTAILSERQGGHLADLSTVSRTARVKNLFRCRNIGRLRVVGERAGGLSIYKRCGHCGKGLRMGSP